MTTTLETPNLLTFTISIVVFFGGAGLNRCIAPLRRWNIPDAVTGGLLASLVTLVAYRVFGLEITFDLDVRDMLLLYFFTGIGLNARLSDLFRGGRPFFILLASRGEPGTKFCWRPSQLRAFLVPFTRELSGFAAIFALDRPQSVLDESDSGSTRAHWQQVCANRWLLSDRRDSGAHNQMRARASRYVEPL
jgi:hypothetical protein